MWVGRSREARDKNGCSTGRVCIFLARPARQTTSLLPRRRCVPFALLTATRHIVSRLSPCAGGRDWPPVLQSPTINYFRKLLPVPFNAAARRQQQDGETHACCRCCGGDRIQDLQKPTARRMVSSAGIQLRRRRGNALRVADGFRDTCRA